MLNSCLILVGTPGTKKKKSYKKISMDFQDFANLQHEKLQEQVENS